MAQAENRCLLLPRRFTEAFFSRRSIRRPCGALCFDARQLIGVPTPRPPGRCRAARLLDVGWGLRLRSTARAIDMLPGGIAHHCCARRNIACNDTPSADDRIIADRDARQDDRASADPY